MKGTSKTKFCKGTDIPKRSGNYSYFNSDEYKMHYQSKEYPVKRNSGGTWIVGDRTPLNNILPEQLVWLVDNDPNFYGYKEKGTHTHCGKKYDCERSINKCLLGSKYGLPDYKLYICINTQGDFNYNFPEY